MKRQALVVIIAICIIIGGIGVFQLYSYYSQDKAAEKAFEQLLPVDEMVSGGDTAFDGDWISYDYMLPYYEGLRKQNPDMVGWLFIPGTRISYPVMQTVVNQEYYLDKNFNKEYSTAGSLFASAFSDVEIPSDVVTVYGHRMKTGAMFGSLGDFLNPDFLSEHETIIFDTFAERYKYKIYAVFSLDVDIENSFAYYDCYIFVSPNEFNEFANKVRTFASVINSAHTPIYGDKFLLLSTCEYTHKNGRLVIVAVKKKDK